MSKYINKKKFDNKTLGIKQEINEEIGQLKNNRIHYTSSQNLKNNKSKEKQNYLNQRVNIRFEERNRNAILNQKKSNTKTNYNNKDNINLSRDKLSKKSTSKSKEKVQLIKTKVIKKKNIGQVERVVIDLINEDIDSYKTDLSNTYSINDSEKQNRYNKEFKNKDNNGTNSTNSVNERLIAINKIEGRWLNNSISNQEINFSFIFDQIQSQKKQIENMINNWKKNNTIKKEVDINFISEKKEENKIKMKEKEMNDLLLNWNNNLKEDNKINVFYEEIKEKNIFKYSEEKYLNDILSKVPFPDKKNNTNNIFYLLNMNYISNLLTKLNYKVVNPKDKIELESLVKNFYNENKLNNNLNKSNNSFDQVYQINPLMILNEEQMSLLNEKINKNKIKDSVEITGTDSKKENIDTLYTISKQIAIDYEIIEQSQSNISKTDKQNDIRKVYQNFGQSTPLSMLYEKFLVFAVSRNIKYSVHSSQNNIFYENHLNKNKTNGFEIDKLMINTFSLWVEKIDKIESTISNEKKEN